MSGLDFGSARNRGKYEITGILSSYGLDSQIIYNDLVEHPDEIKKLPYQGWKGSISSNKLWITVGPPSQKH